MKTTLKHALVLAALVALTNLAFAGDKAVRDLDPIVPYDPLVDMSGNDISADPDAPLYGALCNLFFGLPNNPIIAPDGHHVTVGEWSQATGKATVKCTPSGTHITMQLKHLIPNGVYTIWLATFTPPGADFDWTYSKAIGPLGLQDGSQNVLRVSASGEASLSVFQKAGPMSIKGEVTDCLLDEFEFQLVVAYHLDGKTYGGFPNTNPNGDCYIGEQLGFDFSNH